MKLHFKHVYGPEVAEWGVLGFPSNQHASTALRGYGTGEIVLLAIPENTGDPALRGKIFARCMLLHISGAAINLANPELVSSQPEVASRWPTAIAVHRLWQFDEPVAYRGAVQVAQTTEMARGRMIPIENMREFSELPATEVPVYHSEWVRERLAA